MSKLPSLPDGFEFISVRDLKVGQFFFFRKGGLRLNAFIVSKDAGNTYKITAIKPNGVTITRYVSELKHLITYSN